MRRISPRVVSLFLPLLLAGCSGGLLAPSGPAPKLYMLKAPREVTVTAPQANWQLLIDMPNAQLDLNTARIAIEETQSEIEYYANVAWVDRPTALHQELLLQSFDKSGRIGAVQRQSGGLRADFVLTTDLQDFEVDAASAPPTVRVRVTTRLVRTRDRVIVASHSFKADTPISGDFEGAVTGFNGALRDILPQIVDWTLTEGSRNP
jgi:cholesterol transport system auxiliary component